MSFNPTDFIDISKELQHGNTEAHYRSVIGRSYYGAFGFIRDGLNGNYYGQNVHREVIEALLNSSIRDNKIAGKKLEGLFKKRKESDYKYNTNIRKGTCDFSVKEAEAILTLFVPE